MGRSPAVSAPFPVTELATVQTETGTAQGTLTAAQAEVIISAEVATRTSQLDQELATATTRITVLEAEVAAQTARADAAEAEVQRINAEIASEEARARLVSERASLVRDLPGCPEDFVTDSRAEEWSRLDATPFEMILATFRDVFAAAPAVPTGGRSSAVTPPGDVSASDLARQALPMGARK